MNFRSVAFPVTSLLFLAPFVLAQGDSTDVSKARWVAVAEHGLKVKLPAGWKERKRPGTVLAAARTGKDGSSLSLNIRSVSGVTAASLQTKAFAQQLRKSLTESLAGYVPAGDGAVEIAGSPAMWLRGSVGDKQIIQYLFVGGDVGFIATFIYPTDGAEQSAKAVESIVDSIGIGPKEAVGDKEAGGTKESVAKSQPKVLGAEIVKGRVQAAHGFSLKMPKGWQLAEPTGGTFLQVTGPDGTNLNVVQASSLSSKLDPEAVAAEVQLAYKKSLAPDYKVRSSRSVRIAGRLGVWLDARYSVGERKLSNLQLLLPGKSHGFVVTFTAPTEVYGKHISKVKRALRTIRVD
ncbi:MAG: hypothetical protein VYE77_08270 [Planctomycetota bacterium]|nr:hypothetical protein [Planctomycetota bacterium]